MWNTSSQYTVCNQMLMYNFHVNYVHTVYSLKDPTHATPLACKHTRFKCTHVDFPHASHSRLLSPLSKRLSRRAASPRFDHTRMKYIQKLNHI